ncbi:phosphotransferase [Labrys neptuniae]
MAEPPDLKARLGALPLWGGPISIEPSAGGLTNRNLLITAPTGRYVARLAGDNAAHDIDRAAEQAATRAAAQCGLGPELVWAEPGLMILRHIEGRTLTAADFADPERLSRVLGLLKRVHRDLPTHYRGAARDRSLATILTGYAARLEAMPNRWRQAARRHHALLERLQDPLRAAQPGFAHNDVHGDNLIDDGERLWLLDWEYAGQGQPLADLASLVNNGLLGEDAAQASLEAWLGRSPVVAERELFAAMRLAAALRDLFWGYAQDGLVAGGEGKLDGYIAINEGRVSAAAARV